MAGTERAVTHYRELRHFAIAHRHDHLGAVLGDAAALVFLADHEAGDVLQEHDRRAGLIAQLDEVRALERGVVEQHRSEEHTSELQSLMRNSYAVFCLIKKKWLSFMLSTTL